MMLGTAGITAVHVRKLGKEREKIFGKLDANAYFLRLSHYFDTCFSGHSIDEIRLRALDNIISKYDLGFMCDCDAVKKEIIQKLFNWFSFETALQPEKVLNLLLRLLKVFRLFY